MIGLGSISWVESLCGEVVVFAYTKNGVVRRFFISATILCVFLKRSSSGSEAMCV